MVLKVLELYSGIGGMHFALQACAISFEVVASIDINPLARSVYRCNFPKTPFWEKNIEGLRASILDKLCLDMVVMSPPCQPFTRVGLKQDISDPRTKSFLHFMDVLTQLKHLPQYLLLENVKGFETSKTHEKLVETLLELGYSWQGFLVSPKQLGIPNSRLRYYLLAKKLPERFQAMSNRPLSSHPSLGVTSGKDCANDDIRFIPETNPIVSESQLEHLSSDSCKQIKSYLEQTPENTQSYALPAKTIERYLSVMDVVTPQSRTSTCFTKSYGKYAEGTGSVLNVAEPGGPPELRYFTPREVGNLMGFPEKFQFPADLSLRQKYRLLGNSLNIAVVAYLLNMLVDEQNVQ